MRKWFEHLKQISEHILRDILKGILMLLVHLIVHEKEQNMENVYLGFYFYL